MLRLLKSVIIFAFLSAGLGLYAQTPQKVEGPKPKRWVTGGDFGAGFSNYGSQILISPQLGYRITSRLESGARLTYSYSSYKMQGAKVSSSNYGGGLYTSFLVFKGLFAHAENELLSYQPLYYGSGGLGKGERQLVHSIFIGAGYRQYFSAFGYGSVMILYNLNETMHSPYNNPLFRIGFGYGF